MDRIDLDNWTAKEVARLLTLVENDRRYYQEILTTLAEEAPVVVPFPSSPSMQALAAWRSLLSTLRS